MSAQAGYLSAAVAVGLGATLFMDLCALFLNRAFGVPLANYCLVGRWLCNMSGGTFVHASIAAATAKRAECMVGWTAHYVIGVLYAFVLIGLVSSSWLVTPSFLPAILFGVGSVVVPFLVMQPSFGLGIAASRAPNPTQSRLRSLMAHATFGVGLYACAVPISHVL